jgi:hypothetical protein
MALYFTGCKHAGENLAEVLETALCTTAARHSNV